ncbi:predicted protein [Histoplasma capsulatum var. duboisii H88]|nr:predicted protein [Histoplasma capsulatum var. duboisii H88]
MARAVVDLLQKEPNLRGPWREGKISKEELRHKDLEIRVVLGVQTWGYESDKLPATILPGTEHGQTISVHRCKIKPRETMLQPPKVRIISGLVSELAPSRVKPLGDAWFLEAHAGRRSGVINQGGSDQFLENTLHNGLKAQTWQGTQSKRDIGLRRHENVPRFTSEVHLSHVSSLFWMSRMHLLLTELKRMIFIREPQLILASKAHRGWPFGVATSTYPWTLLTTGIKNDIIK